MTPPAVANGILPLPRSIAQVLARRGLQTLDDTEAFLGPSLERLASPHVFGQMQIAVDRLLAAIRAEQPIAIYADRDVDGLTGLAILVRTLRSLGGTVVWGSPTKGRGVDRATIEKLAAQSKVMVLVDCGTGEHTELSWLASQGVDVIVADHHRFTAEKPQALAWIHPGVLEKTDGHTPAGCVMAFKLAQGLWQMFLGTEDPERMDYFLFGHLDLVCLGILADRMPLRGENRILVWHGLRRLAASRKIGLATLTRFFRLTPRSGPLSVREVTWQLIPMLNAAGRLGRPEVTAEFLITEDADVARACIDELLALNTQRRAAQDVSLTSFEKAVIEQCAVDTDPVLVALAEGLEPSVTGLAAQALARKYNRPVFLFVNQGVESVGSGRGTTGIDLYTWIQGHPDLTVKFGGHTGAVGMTIRTAEFKVFRERLIATALETLVASDGGASQEDVGREVEAELLLQEMDAAWWNQLEGLGPFGPGNPWPVFKILNIEAIVPAKKRRGQLPIKEVFLRAGGCEILGKFVEQPSPGLWPPSPSVGRGFDNQSPRPAEGEGVGGEGLGPWTVVGYPVPVKKGDKPFDWMIREMWRNQNNGAE